MPLPSCIHPNWSLQPLDFPVLQRSHHCRRSRGAARPPLFGCQITIVEKIGKFCLETQLKAENPFSENLEAKQKLYTSISPLSEICCCLSEKCNFLQLHPTFLNLDP